MSSISGMNYEMMHIPCAHPQHHNGLEDGHSQRTVDGKVVGNGIIVHGKCVPTSSQRIFTVNGFSAIRYSGTRTPTANNAQTAMAAAAQRL